MASHKLDRGASTRLGTQAVNPQRNPSSRLPARTPTLPTPSGIPTPPSTKLVKRKPISSKGNDQLPTRTSSKSGVRRLAGEELRRELAVPRSLPTLAHIMVESQRTQQVRGKLQATTRVTRFEPTRTPSLVSGSSVSTVDSPRSNLIRRKPSNIGSKNVRTSPDSMSSREGDTLSNGYKDPYPEDAVLGITMPPSSTYQSTAREEVINLDKYVDPLTLATIELPPPSQFYAVSATSSTGYSPGPFSVSSTPTSMSSASPGILAPSNSKHGPRVSQPSPTRSRPPVVRFTADEKATKQHSQGLAPVRESSSSSASTIRGSDGGKQKDRHRLSHLPAPPPGPLQKSSDFLKQHNRRKSDPVSPAKSKFPPPAPTQRPPELAHLSNMSPRKGSLGSKPVRPSRDGTPEFNLRDMSPIIQSNMASLPQSLHKRQSSSESRRAESKRAVASGLKIDTKTRFGLPRAQNPSPSPSQASALSPFSSRPPTRGTTPELFNTSEKALPIKPSPSSESKPFSRFGFFSRRNKTESGATPATKEKKVRKGPVAGTGHEGYGKFAFRGRSGSTTSGSGGTSSGRSPSTDTIENTQPSSRKSSIGSKAGSDVDEFYAERLNPITLRGTGSTQRALERSQSEGSQGSLGEHAATRGLALVAPKSGSAISNQVLQRPVLLPSPMSDPTYSGSPVKRPATSDSKKEQSEDKGSRFGLSSLSTRRASRRSFLGGKSLASLADNSSSATPPSPSMGGTISRQNTAPGGSMFGTEDGTEINRPLPVRADTQPKAQLKPPKKWNFFQRAKSPARKDSSSQDTPAITVSRQLPPRSVAHYAMMDAPPPIDADELEKIMQEAESSAPESNTPLEMEEPTVQRSKSRRHGNSILLPEPPSFIPEFAGPARPASPKVTLQPRLASPEPSTSALAQIPRPSEPPSSQVSLPTLPRPSRLAQVGRIPRVVSKRDRERKLSDASFSRPFVPTQPSPALKNGTFPQEPYLASPELVKARTAEDSPPRVQSSSEPEREGYGESEKQSAYTGSGEFFTFPARKNSEQSVTSSGSSMLNTLATTAVLPKPGAPPLEDEVWNEYDDLLDLLSLKTPKTPKTPLTGSSLGAPFQYNGFDSKAPTPSRHVTSPDLAEPSVSSFAKRIRLPSLHDSRLLSPMPSTGTPTSAFRMSDFLNGYLSVVDPVSGRLSLASTGRLSSSTVRLSLPPTIRPLSTSATTKPRAGSLSQTPVPQVQSEQPDPSPTETGEVEDADYLGTEASADLRFGALMTSKWLSFGRVLFSPIHFELKNQAEDRVLILDGLGKDWSYYVALTYPNATIYNLGTDPADSTSSDTTAGGPFPALSNYRHIHHPSLNAPFPFPKGFFAAVVFRFPTATSETAYRNAFFECKRVLRPGGYIEVSVLDIDMLNMGSRTRSALRSLKMQMQSQEPNISLKPMSDSIQRLLGRRGFENMNRCMVGVPAAGRIPGSRDESWDGTEPTSAITDSSTSSTRGKQRTDDNVPPLTDLLSAQSADGDEGITKMVARIGRWWYSRCYESLALPDGSIRKSIWTDDALIRECEKRGTNLRLMVCFAQKPDCPVRRTISV
jgi:hypothetical protein